MSKIIVIHHSADFDGLFSREIARQKFGPLAEYIGWDYGDPVPDVSGVGAIYMIDVSIDALMSDPRLIWIDHHKSALGKYPDAAREGYCIDGVAACRLAWQVFNNPVPFYCDLPTKQEYVDHTVSEPLAVRLAGEYDVWDKRDPRAEVFQFGLKCGALDDAWEWLLGDDPEALTLVQQIIDSGATAQVYAGTVNAEIISAYSFNVVFEGLTFLALNTARCNSLTFQSAVRPEHDGLLGFRYDGKQWTVSLYGVPHKPDVDLSVIAAKYGGGGRKQACGFQCADLPFLVQKD